MRVCWLWLTLVSLVLFATVSRSLAEDAGTRDAIDLTATRALVNQWGSRPSFPESVTFAYYHVYMARALGQEITPETRQKVVAYIAGCQQPDGGFTPAPAHAKTASAIYTYYALLTLDLLGESKAIDRKATIGFLRARIQQGGGMTATARSGEQASLATSYYGIEALRLLGAVDLLERAAVTRGWSRINNTVCYPASRR